MRVYLSISLSAAVVVVFFVGVSMEASLSVARSRLQTVVTSLTTAHLPAPAWAH